MVIRRNGPFDDMALDDMVLAEVLCSPLDYIMMQADREQVY